MAISKDLFDVLACPKDKANLQYNDDKTALVCTKCKSKYAIKEGIPILLKE